MTTPQKPIGSGFGMRTTAAEAVAGIDLSGKNIIVTGGYSGLGFETTKALAQAGAQVTVPARRKAHAEEELAKINPAPGSIAVDEMDLADLDSVKAFGERFLASGKPLHILVNNAAIMACPETRVGPGWEAQFATNHLGHYVLLNTLYPALKAAGGARVVALSSTGHKLSPIRWDDVMFKKGGYDKWVAYGQAKTANALFAVHLDEVAQKDGIRAFAVHPGGIMTPLQRYLPREEMIAAGWMDEDGNVNELFKTPEEGASTTVFAATSPKLDGMGGVYCENADIAPETDPGNEFARYMGVDAHAIDRDAAARLWALSADLTDVNVFG